MKKGTQAEDILNFFSLNKNLIDPIKKLFTIFSVSARNSHFYNFRVDWTYVEIIFGWELGKKKFIGELFILVLLDLFRIDFLKL